MGAGIIPFSIKDKTVWFLFHQTFSGRREGFLVDFGGGLKAGEDYRRAAVREFVEETETMYFETRLAEACRSEARVQAQIQRFDRLFEQTQSPHPNWWCRRAPGNKQPPKDWRSYFVAVPYRELEAINQEWANAAPGRFSKRRRLLWLGADELLHHYAETPEKLWKRVRQLEGAPAVIRDIVKAHGGAVGGG